MRNDHVTEKVGMNLADGLLLPYDLNATCLSETCFSTEPMPGIVDPSECLTAIII